MSVGDQNPSAPPPDDPFYLKQYYLDMSNLPGAVVDLNMGDVWDDYTGVGVKVGVFDSAIDWRHPDLDDNYDASMHRELDGDGLPTEIEWGPQNNESHGTPVAGIIAAERNGVGTVGVAYDATITGVRLFGKFGWLGTNEMVEAMAELWRFDITNHSWSFTPPFELRHWDPWNAPFYAALDKAIEEGRGGLGTIIVTGAGNDKSSGGSSDVEPLLGSRYAIPCAAVDFFTGYVTAYSAPGANVFVSTPSSSGLSSSESTVTTTDRPGEYGYDAGSYTERFGGTSSSAPMVSGIVALMLDANPTLGWRDVKDILALTARHTGTAIGGVATSPERDTWTVNAGQGPNAAGFHFSRDYGYGLVDAHSAVRLAETWTGQRTSANEVALKGEWLSTTERTLVTTQSEFTFTLAAGVSIEAVEVDTDLWSRVPGGVRIEVIAPSGTSAFLFMGSGYMHYAFPGYVFNANAFRGEESEGVWTVKVQGYRDSEASLSRLSLTVYGSASSDDDVHVFTPEYGTLILGDGVLRDVAGHDVLNAAAQVAAAIIDLTPGAVSTIAGRTLTIDAAAWIEDAIGGDGGDAITGNSLANRLMGMRGDDTLSGGDGADTLIGGRGNDVYLNPHGDTIVEEAGGGYDEIHVTASYVLTGDLGIEVVRLLGTDSISVTGDGGANLIGGNYGDNLMLGGGGADSLFGGGGGDTLLGGEGRDLLNGGVGADRLDGGEGNDRLVGGTAGDVYVSPQGDVIVELAGQGFDWVETNASFSLVDVANVEGLLVLGAVPAFMWGNELANSLVGNAGSNRMFGYDGDDLISGLGGRDTIDGGLGRDRLYPGLERDTLVYRDAAASTGAGGDIVYGWIFSVGGAAYERLDFTVLPTVVRSTVIGGVLNELSFDLDLAQAVDASRLGVGEAVLFDPDSGDRAAVGHVYLIVDANGVAGYQAGADYVIEFVSPHGALSLDNFI